METAARVLRNWPVSRWIGLLAWSLYFAAIFWGADQGLDALHGAHNRRGDVKVLLGGLELWMVFFPGLFSVALAGLLFGLLRQAVLRPKPAGMRTSAAATNDGTVATQPQMKKFR